jgi:hypothetical protein
MSLADGRPEATPSAGILGCGDSSPLSYFVAQPFSAVCRCAGPKAAPPQQKAVTRARRRSPDLAESLDRRSPESQTRVQDWETFGPGLCGVGDPRTARTVGRNKAWRSSGIGGDCHGDGADPMPELPHAGTAPCRNCADWFRPTKSDSCQARCNASEYARSQRTASPGGSALAVLWCWSCYEHNGWHHLGETGMGDGDKSIAARKCQPSFFRCKQLASGGSALGRNGR